MESQVKLIKGGVAVDDRGCLSFVNDFKFDGVKRFYIVENHQQGFIRAWHGHQYEGKYAIVVSGSAIVGTAEMAKTPAGLWKLVNPQRFVLSSKTPSVLWIPPMHANGFKSLTDDLKIIYFSTSTIDQSKDDDIRFKYDKIKEDGLVKFWDVEFR